MTRTKFRVTQVAHNEGSMSTVSLVVVTKDSPENKVFFKYTPGGSISLTVVNPEVASKFVPGKEYYVDFTEAE